MNTRVFAQDKDWKLPISNLWRYKRTLINIRIAFLSTQKIFLSAIFDNYYNFSDHMYMWKLNTYRFHISISIMFSSMKHEQLCKLCTWDFLPRTFNLRDASEEKLCVHRDFQDCFFADKFCFDSKRGIDVTLFIFYKHFLIFHSKKFSSVMLSVKLFQNQNDGGAALLGTNFQRR